MQINLNHCFNPLHPNLFQDNMINLFKNRDDDDDNDDDDNDDDHHVNDDHNDNVDDKFSRL